MVFIVKFVFKKNYFFLGKQNVFQKKKEKNNKKTKVKKKIQKKNDFIMRKMEAVL